MDEPRASEILMKISCVREISDERDKRYEQRFVDQEKAVVLARTVAMDMRGKVSLLTVISAISLLLAVIGYFK